MVELHIEIDCVLAHISDTEGDNVVILGKGRVVFVLSPLGTGVLVNCLFINDM